MPTAVSSDNLTRAEAQARANLISEISYDIDLSLDDDPSATSFRCATSLHFHAAQTERTFIDLTADSVERIELNGHQLDQAAFTGTRIELPELAIGENHLTVIANCLYSHTGVGLHRVVDPIDSLVYVYTHFEPFDAHKVFACFDQPDLKARFTLKVTAPATWTVVSNYPSEHETAIDAGRTTRHFAPTPLLSTYLIAMVGGAYHAVHSNHEGIQLGIYCRQSLAEHLDPDEIFTITKQGLDFFSAYFDCPYPFQKYDQLLVPEFNMGAMENPGCITFNETYLFRSKVTESVRMARANTILHEMAHMWFGDLVTMRWWDDLWLNESFATYMAHLAIAEATRFEASWVDFAVAMKGWALRQDQLPTTHPISADIVDIDSVHLNFDGITYAKGASVLRQLVAWVGDNSFRDGLRGYFRAHAWGNATLSDFLAVLEQASGRQLRPWSQEWLETTGAGLLQPELVVENGNYTSFNIAQSAPKEHPTLRSHRLGVGLYDDRDGHLVLRRRVDLDVSGAQTPVPDLIGEPHAALVVLNDGDLAFTKIRLDADSVRSLIASPNGIDDPLTRAICTAALWDMTRDAEIATRDYIAITARQAQLETETGTLDRVLMQALTAIDMYGEPGNRIAARQVLHQAAATAFAAAGPGSDLQLVWARCLVSCADSDADLDRIAQWLEQEAVAGLRVDTDLRWHVITRLATAGRVGEAEISVETKRDPSDIGARRAASALAARPQPSAKADTWHQLLDTTGVPLQMLNALVRGFSQGGQDELLQPYVERYFDVLPQIWATRSVNEADHLTEGLYPRFIVSDQVISGVDQALKDVRLGTIPQRILSEARDGTLRAQRARAADVASAK